MSTSEQRAMQMLGVTEEAFKKIQEAFKLFPGLWDDLSFVEMWQSIPDDACSALLEAVEVIARKDEEARAKDRRIDQLQQTIHSCAERLVHEYAENGSETTKEVGIEAVGEREFYAMLLEGGYDLNEYDREDIANLLR
jgi:hypothetical protein